ncbi:MAG: ATP-binding protein, partial [Chloroflexota bacterium]
MLLGRDPELRAVDRALADARLGRSTALLIRGEVGIGKTALLDYAVGEAAAMRVLSARGVEFEADVPFAGLHELLRPALGLIDRLPATQGTALRSSLGLGERVEADRLVIGAATLGLVSAFAEEAPLLVVVDDAQWLDPGSAEALAFAVRRLLADPVAVLVTLRAGEESALAGAGLPELTLAALDRPAAAELLAGAAAGVAPESAAAILDASAGNPLAVLELAGEASHLPIPGRLSPLPIATTVERAYLRRAVGLGPGARRALLLMATAGSADLAVVARARQALGLAAADVHAAE